MLSTIKNPNFILAADSYKTNHVYEIPAGVQYVVSAIVPRKVSKRLKINKIVAAGMAVIAEILVNVRITYDMIDEAETEITEQGYTFYREGWERIVRECDGRLPIAMYGVEEGRVVDPQTPLAMFTNTKPGFGWLVSYIETWTQDIVWSMSTTASICREARMILREAMIKTGADLSMLDYKLHNFGDRATRSPEEAPVLAGIAHGMVFNGSDCLRANSYIKRIYKTKKAYLSSVEATEHSTMCMNSNAETKDDWGAAVMAVERLEAVVKRVKETGIGIPIMSAVVDTYDSHRFVGEYIGTRLKDRIINSGGRFVCRPDSGDPCVEPGDIGDIIADKFGYTLSSTGHKVFPAYIGELQGDGLNINTLPEVVDAYVSRGFSMDNILFGMGNGTTQDGFRDDFSFSMKAMACSNDGVTWRRLLKEPKTDVTKKSLSGLVRCNEVDGTLEVIDMTNDPAGYFAPSIGWRCYVRDAQRDYEQSFDDVCARARSL